MNWKSRPRDYWGDARKSPAGGGWLGIYRVPWQSRPVYLHGQDKKPAVFRSREEALQAVMNHTHSLMCPYIASGGSQIRQKAREEGEALFAKGGAVETAG